MKHENLFYTTIGAHAGENIEDILKNKIKEISECKFSLWAANIKSTSLEALWKLDKNDKVYVLGSISKGAKDPSEKDNGKSLTADIIIKRDGTEEKIPKGIVCTFPLGHNYYYAYKVKKYIINEKEESYDLGQYETLVKEKGRKIMKLFSDYSNRGQDQFGHLNPNLNDKKEYKYVVCMELEYPFVEKITCSKNNNK
ncbi:MAG: hypothetical protein SOZ71_07345 [Clostridium sp.]|nr:hypothetical protein [Clostridium sp.]